MANFTLQIILFVCVLDRLVNLKFGEIRTVSFTVTTTLR